MGILCSQGHVERPTIVAHHSDCDENVAERDERLVATVDQRVLSQRRERLTHRQSNVFLNCLIE
jgi:hypothetical protein